MRQKIRVFFMRLPKNLVSNRWWIWWNGRLYINAPTAPLNTTTQMSLAEWLEHAPQYVSPSVLLTGRARVSPQAHAIFLPELGMFGNMTKRLAGGLAVAGATGICHVVVPRSAEFYHGLFRHGVHQCSQDLTLWFCSLASKSGNPIKVLYKVELLQGPGGRHDYSPSESEGVWEQLHRVVIPQGSGGGLPSDHLVIHLRGGDVFGPRKPRAYGQPPLAFYELILKRYPWSAVTIVHEDFANPVLDGIVAASTALNIPITHQSGSVPEDIAVLMTARSLAAGRGTFVPAIVGLSRCVERVFFFEDKFSLFPDRETLDIQRIFDSGGDYVAAVLSHNWENSDEQRDLMLSYPVQNLTVENS